MSFDHAGPPQEDRAFHTTRWTLVTLAHGNSAVAKEALSDLCSRYYAPLVAFLFRDGRTEDAARDLAHEFFAQVLNGNTFEGADRNKGRFRYYLLGAVRHFLANRWRDAARTRRGGGVTHVPLGVESHDAPALDPADESAAVSDAAFDRAWALAVVERALEQLQSESDAAGQSKQFSTLRPWLTPGGAEESQASAAGRIGMSEGAMRVAVHRLRRRFREIVRAEILQTLHDPAELDDEMRHLIDALAQ